MTKDGVVIVAVSHCCSTLSHTPSSFFFFVSLYHHLLVIEELYDRPQFPVPITKKAALHVGFLFTYRIILSVSRIRQLACRPIKSAPILF
jgi:hypothetical protein